MRPSQVAKWNFALRTNELLLTYEVSNNAATDLFLLNKLYNLVPRFVISPDIVYIHLDRGTRTAKIYKHYPPMPGEGYEPIMPFWDVVRAGSTFREQVRVPLPVWEKDPYLAMEAPKKAKAATYDFVYFSLGYWWAMPGQRTKIKDVQGYPIVTPVGGSPATPDRRGVLETDRVELSFPVLERADAPNP